MSGINRLCDVMIGVTSIISVWIWFLASLPVTAIGLPAWDLVVAIGSAILCCTITRAIYREHLK